MLCIHSLLFSGRHIFLHHLFPSLLQSIFFVSSKLKCSAFSLSISLHKSQPSQSLLSQDLIDLLQPRYFSLLTLCFRFCQIIYTTFSFLLSLVFFHLSSWPSIQYHNSECFDCSNLNFYGEGIGCYSLL